MISLAFSISFGDLYCVRGLRKLDAKFLEFLLESYPDLYHQLMLARGSSFSQKQESSLIVELAPIVEEFIAELFSLNKEITALSNEHNQLAPVFWCKRQFIQRKVAKHFDLKDLGKISKVVQYFENINLNLEDEILFSQFVQKANEENNIEKLEYAKLYAGWALFSPEGKKKHKSGVLFKVPKKTDQLYLIEINKDENKSYKLPMHEVKNRGGFDHTDTDINLKRALDQANYCIGCHNQQKDSCSHGIKDQLSNNFIANELNVKLAGCPLEEKISEMNTLKANGSIIGALATAIIDNPMIAATGYRICNDCMKSCIYQKQEPVNVPMVETQVLNDVLKLPFGFEIYSLLTRWNPLNFKTPYPKEINKHKILIAGLGPAGFTLAHYLLNQGFIVVGIDGLKIEHLDPEISGIDQNGGRVAFKPIEDVETLFSRLSERIPQGFGGVAEYGITVRWNKNYLTLIRLLLERRENFRMYGGIRFGGTITYKSALKLGFDHIALALGAGKPNIPQIPNILTKGVRAASDFLMALQLTGASRKNTFVNLQIRLPIVVIGGGLTAIDTAIESIAYYQVLIERFAEDYAILGDKIFDNLSPEEKEIILEYLEHAKKLKANPQNKVRFLREWGGVKIIYRRSLQESPSYRLNHEEVEKAFEEGVEFIEDIIPKAILKDNYGNCTGIEYDGGVISAKTILIATGTHPNTVLAKEDNHNFKLDNQHFVAIDENLKPVIPEKISKPKQIHVLTSINKDGKAVSFFGDLHPSFAGNVVKAMGSAKQGYPIVANIVKKYPPINNSKPEEFFKNLDSKLIAVVEKVIELTPNIIELVIRAPIAAEEFKPGQFYRLQNYDCNAVKKKGYNFAMEGIALTGAWVDKERGLISVVVLEMGGSTNLCRYLKSGESVVLMGPTGAPTEIPINKTVLLIGGGLGNAVLFSIGKALRESNCKVLYFAGYRKKSDRYKAEEIVNASHLAVWCCEEELLDFTRKEDRAFHGNVIQAIRAYGDGELGTQSIQLHDVDRIITIGSDKMMGAVAHARHSELKKYFKNDHIAVGSINSPMQCMMKEICAQCLQRHIDPITQKESYVFSCFNQDQMLDEVDFYHLNSRLSQNSLQEKVCAKMIKELLTN